MKTHTQPWQLEDCFRIATDREQLIEILKPPATLVTMGKRLSVSDDGDDVEAECPLPDTVAYVVDARQLLQTPARNGVLLWMGQHDRNCKYDSRL